MKQLLLILKILYIAAILASTGAWVYIIGHFINKYW